MKINSTGGRAQRIRRKDRGRRRCLSCDCWLRVGNRGRYCAPCERRRIKQGQS